MGREQNTEVNDLESSQHIPIEKNEEGCLGENTKGVVERPLVRLVCHLDRSQEL